MNFIRTTIFLIPLLIILSSGCVTTQDKDGQESSTQVPEVPRPQPQLKGGSLDPGGAPGADGSESATGADETDDTQEDPEGDLADDEWDADEELTQGFCADDIYGQFLTNLYRLQNPERMKTTKTKVIKKIGKGKKSKKRVLTYAKNTGEYEALLFASERMNGKTASYYGAIPVLVNEDVYFWVHYFKTAGRKIFLKWLMRGEALRQSVQPVLQDHGIPIEFFYLAMIESGFNHKARSSAKAEGTWQFMKGTAKLYGLRINRFVDERRDPIKSTIAAATYLKDLYAELGDWYLAMAAYNAGPGRIKGAIRRTGASDYWALAATPHMPHETKQYVPKVLAALLLASDARGHGFEVVPNQQDFLPESEVLVKSPVRLDDLAARLGISVSMIKRWNPELVGSVTPPLSALGGRSDRDSSTDTKDGARTNEGYPLRLPTLYAIAWNDVESQIQKATERDLEATGKTHVVRRGETLSRIARRYSVTVQDLKAANPGLHSQSLRPGKVLNIPLVSGPDVAEEKLKKRRSRAG